MQKERNKREASLGHTVNVYKDHNLVYRKQNKQARKERRKGEREGGREERGREEKKKRRKGK